MVDYELENSRFSYTFIIFETPKSANCNRPSADIKMFAGFMSLCTTFLICKNSIPCKMSIKKLIRSCNNKRTKMEKKKKNVKSELIRTRTYWSSHIFRFCCCIKYSDNGPRRAYSITMHTHFVVLKCPRNFIMRGCCKFFSK